MKTADELRRPQMDLTWFNEILEDVLNGETLNEICEDPEVPHRRAFMAYMLGNSEHMARWRTVLQAVAYEGVDDIMSIADDGRNDWMKGRNGAEVVNTEAIARSRLRVDVRKWAAERLLKDFQVTNRSEVTGAEGKPIVDNDQLALQLASIINTKEATPTP